ncbi:hypothetical protein EJB05_24865, partial [Eragrostis curvula]
MAGRPLPFVAGMRPGRGDMIPVQQPPNPRAPQLAVGGGLRGLSAVGGALIIVFLTANAGMAIYRSLGDAGAIASITSAYLNLVALFICVVLFVKAPADDPNSPRRNRLKAAAWLLTMALTFQYVYEGIGTTTTTPNLNVALLLWAMPAATGIAVFYVFFQE